MRRSTYFKRASKRFLEGTRRDSPCEAVASGKRTLEQWAAMLAEERDIELHHQAMQRPVKHFKVIRVIRASSAHSHSAV
jgi:hypothetical protein